MFILDLYCKLCYNNNTWFIQSGGIYMSTIAIRVDEELKDEATKLYKSMGLDMTSAIKLFLTQSVLTQSIPFMVKAYDSSYYDDNGDLITSERLLSATNYLKQHAKKNAVRIDDSNPEHEAMLFDEEW